MICSPCASKPVLIVRPIRILAGEVLRRHGFVDDDDAARAVCVGRRKAAPLPHLDPHRLEILRRHDTHEGGHAVEVGPSGTFTPQLSLDPRSGNRCVAAAARTPGTSRSDGITLRYACRRSSAVIWAGAVTSTTATVSILTPGSSPRRLAALRIEPGARREQHGEANLRDDETALQPPPTH